MTSLDKAELLAVLFEALLYGKARQRRIVGRDTDRRWIRPLAGDVRRNDPDAVMPTVHSRDKPWDVLGGMCVTVV